MNKQNKQNKEDLKNIFFALLIIYFIIPAFLMNTKILIEANMSFIAIGFFFVGFVTNGFTIMYFAKQIGEIIERRTKKRKKAYVRRGNSLIHKSRLNKKRSKK